MQIPFEITQEWVDSVVCTAFDGDCGGCWYWIKSFGIDSSNVNGDYEFTTDIISRGGAYLISTEDDETDTSRRFNLATLLKGYKKYVKWAMKKDRQFYLDPSMIDAEEADIIVQFGLFGEIIYG